MCLFFLSFLPDTSFSVTSTEDCKTIVYPGNVILSSRVLRGVAERF